MPRFWHCDEIKLVQVVSLKDKNRNLLRDVSEYSIRSQKDNAKMEIREEEKVLEVPLMPVFWLSR